MRKSSIANSLIAITVMAFYFSVGSIMAADNGPNDHSKKHPLADIADRYLSELSMTTNERQCMEFLYQWMPLNDYADYSPQFFLDNTRAALNARNNTPWGQTLPDSLFMHFVLPVRVNNEQLDSFRTTYQHELLSRVEGMSMSEAALEINHWCHEHVTYMPSDARTSSPLATMRTATGRCGEESVLTVAALRAVGLPARQVYTPRWAHTDDNHAWIEVWTDGHWHFMGACEPEAVLDLAWFNGPASRAMLMHTQVMGAYSMADDIINQNQCYTEINVISNYVDTRRNTVVVTDCSGRRVDGAQVEFKIYNYAEFCTVVTLKTDHNGEAHLTTGRGDMVAWASSGGRFGYAKMQSDTTTVCLSHRDGDMFVDSLDITPPADGMIATHVSAQQTAWNKQRLAHEDSLRAAYTGTFVSTDEAIRQGFSADAADMIAASMGNHDVIAEALRSDQSTVVLDLLKTLSKKDLRDVSSTVLKSYIDRAKQAPSSLPHDVWAALIAPRVENEPLLEFSVPTDGRDGLPSMAAAMSCPDVVARWVADSIELTDELNPRHLRMSPSGVLRLRKADSTSRRIFLVALCRALGVPARLNSVSGKPEYYKYDDASGQWMWLPFAQESNADADSESSMDSKGCFTLCRPLPLAADELPDLTYYRHLSLTKIEQGRGQLLNFENGDATELGAEATWQTTFSKPYSVDKGYYLLTTGTRLASGKALVRLQTFVVNPNDTVSVPLLMRPSNDQLSVVASIDAEARYLNTDSSTATTSSILATTGRGYFMLAILGTHDEPSNHAIRSLQAIADKLNSWHRPLLMLFASDTEQNAFDRKQLDSLRQIHYGIDADGSIQKMLSDALPVRHAPRLPLIVLADTFGRVVYWTEGYNTSIETQVANAIKQL